jgi:translation initiation factor 4A
MEYLENDIKDAKIENETYEENEKIEQHEKEDKDDKDEYYQNIDFQNFDQLDFLTNNGNELLKGIFTYGFERPSPIQCKAVTAIYDGKDLIAQSQSGTGKTAAFTIGMLTKIDPNIKYPQGIIIANTRDLAKQNYYVMTEISKFMNIKICLCVGGTSESKPEENFKEAENSQIWIGTPGRILDLFNRDEKNKQKNNRYKKITNKLKIFIMDEADLLLREKKSEKNEGFLDNIKNIITFLPKSTQMCIFSATYTEKTLKLTEHFMNNSVKILVKQEQVSLDLIKNYWVNVIEERHKYATLEDLYKNINICQAVIFVNSIEKAEELKIKLNKDGHLVNAIHSKIEDTQRTVILKDFRNMKTRVLIATDLLARGIDVQQVGLVINYDIPAIPDEYIHRVGRSGRFGKSGVAINFVTKSRYDVDRMINIEKQYSIKIDELVDLAVINYYLTGINGYNI